MVHLPVTTRPSKGSLTMPFIMLPLAFVLVAVGVGVLDVRRLINRYTNIENKKVTNGRGGVPYDSLAMLVVVPEFSRVFVSIPPGKCSFREVLQ